MVRRRTRRFGDGLRSAREAVMGSAQDFGESTTSTGSSAVQSAQQTAGQVAEQARHAPEVVRRQTQGNPLAAGLIAFGAGLLVATVLPASDAERQAASRLQEAAQPLKEKAIEAGQEMRSNLQESAQGAMGEIQDRARDAVQEVQGETTEKIVDVRDQAKDAVSDVQGSRST
jgi:gas vesicle protein